MSDCLHEETAVALVQGGLNSDEAAVAHRHVDGCEPCRKLLATLARMPTIRRAMGSDPGDADDDARAMRIADRYEIGPVLGAGAMGIVYQARDIRLSRIVALKRVKCVRAADDAHDRLVREALAMARLSHPSVVGVFDAGVADGAAYVAMEYVDGETLREWRLRTRPSLRVISELFVQAGRGLATAHAAGIVHGDFKPDNLLVDRQGRARVADFGLARTVSDHADVAHRIAGTPAYMAPELLAGEAPTAASDQYAWATSLYEAIVGERPYQATSIDELRAEQRRGRPRRGGMPAALARIVERGLAIDPTARYSSMTDAADALAVLPRRRARRLVAVAVGGAAIASGVIAWTAKGESSPPAAALAQPKLPDNPGVRALLPVLDVQLQHGDAEANAGRFDAARAIYDQVVTRAVGVRWSPLEAQAWMAIGHVELKRGRTSDANAALSNAIDAASRARDDRLVAETLIKMLVAVILTTVESSEAERMIKLADAAVTRAGDDPELRAAFHQAAGQMLYLRYQRARGAKHYDQALALWERLPGDHSDQLARLRIARAAEAIDDSDLRRATTELDRARAAIGEPLERSPNASTYLSTACMLHMFLVQLDQARAECTKARDLFAQRLGPDHPDTVSAEGNLGSVLLRQGHGPEALAHLEHAFAVTDAAFGPEHPQTMSARKNLADALGQLGQHARARDHLKELLAAGERALGKDHPKVIETMTLLAGAEISAGDAKAGIERLEKALPLLETHYGRTHQMTVTALNSLAMAYQGAGRRAEAIATFERARSLLIESAGPDDLNVGLITYNLAELAREAGKPADALRMYDEVDRIWSKGLAKTHALFGHLLTGRGEAMLGLHRGQEAAEVLERALPIRISAADDVATAQTELALAEALLMSNRDRARSLVVSATQRLERSGERGAQWRARAERLRKLTR